MNPIHRTVSVVLFLCLAGAASVAAGFQTPRPDLVVSGIDFERVRQDTDVSGGKYWLFNVIVHVRNFGNANSAACKLLLERNNGAGGAFQTACPACLIDVPALHPGTETILPPRQFNNANGAPSVFRATADSLQAVAEANETNNALTLEFKAPAVFEPKLPGDKVPAAFKPDLTVASLDFENVKTSVAGGVTTSTFDLVLTIRNLGQVAAPGYQLVVQQAPVTDPKGSVPAPNGFMVFPSLPANGQVTARMPGLTWKSGTPQRIYTADIDYNNKIDESNETNNHTQKTTPWTAPAPGLKPQI